MPLSSRSIPQKGTDSFNWTNARLENLTAVRTFGPFGMEWKEPDFLLCNIATAKPHFSRKTVSTFRRVCLAASASLALSSLAREGRDQLKSLNLARPLSLNSYKGRTSPRRILVEKMAATRCTPLKS
jgi:hypothetical protein